MRDLKIVRLWCLFLLVPLLLSGCESGDGSADQNSTGGTDGTGGANGGVPNVAAAVAEADGFAQKGPFQFGGTASIQKLAEDGTLLGEPQQTEIGSAGEFKFDGIDWFGASLITVSGDWFNESTGNFAGQPLTLRSVVAIPDPEDVDAESPFPTSVNLLTEAMTHLVLTQLGDEELDTTFNDSVDDANDELITALGFEGDVRDLNLFVLDSQHPRDRQISGVFAKIMIALSAREDLASIIEQAGTSAWDGNEVNEAFAALLQELRVEAAALLEDGGIETARTWLAANYSGVELSRQLTNQGQLGMTLGCNSNEEDAFGNKRLCLGQSQELTLAPNESRLFWFEAPHDGAFRFLSAGTFGVTRSLELFQSINDSGVPTVRLEHCPVSCGTAVGTDIMSEGGVRYLRIRNGNFSSTRTGTIAMRTLNAGSPQNPRWIYPDLTISATFVSQNFTLRTGSRSTSNAAPDTAPLTNRHSYLRFALPAGITRIGVNPSPCQLTNTNMRVYLYRAPGSGGGSTAEAFADPDRLIQQLDGNDCTLELDLTEPSEGEYLLKVVNRRSNVFGVNDPSGSTRSFHVFAN